MEYNGRTYTDAVWILDSNLLETVRAGADEIWVIWCIGNTPEFKKGLVEQYVHMIEMSALGALHAQLAEIEKLNERIARGDSPYGQSRPIAVHIVKPSFPIPLDPDFLAGRVDGSTLVDSGFRDAATYLKTMRPEGMTLTPAATRMDIQKPGLAFREKMTGRITLGSSDPQQGYTNPAAVPFILHASIDVRDIVGFIADANHQGELVGHLYSPRAGGNLPARRGVFRLFSPTKDPNVTEMIYDLDFFLNGRPTWLRGRKYVRAGSVLNAWRETTTLHVTLHEGDDETGDVIGAGILRLGVSDFLSLLGTLHSVACQTRREKLRALFAFANFFASTLWRTYIAKGAAS